MLPWRQTSWIVRDGADARTGGWCSRLLASRSATGEPVGYWRATEPPLRYGLCVGETRPTAVVNFFDISDLL